MALGENGQPVHSAALQLLETLKRKQHMACVNCLAIPQPNEAGDHIDWYAPMEGEITAWSAASFEQREQALVTLDQCQRTLEQVSAQMRTADTQGQKLFGALLGKVMNFPSDDYVYLVDGQPVITFWGFVKTGQKPHKALSLKPSPAPTPDPSTAAPLAEPVPETPLPKRALISDVPVKRTGFNWRWLWWLLLLLLLIPLLLWGLRGCQHWPWTHHALPTSAASLPVTSPDTSFTSPSSPSVDVVSPVPRSHLSTGSGTAPDVALASTSTNTSVVGGPALGSAINAANAPTNGMVAAPSGSTPPTSVPAGRTSSPERLPPVDMRFDAPLQQNRPAAAPDDNEPRLSPHTPTDLAEAYPDLATQIAGLDTLNGRWKVGLGIQDARTGRPLTLDYHFKNGQGTVTLDKGGNVRCEGAVGAMNGEDALYISKQPYMRCSDDSRYETPAVRCAHGSTNALNCQGRYDDGTTIRMTMTREGE